MQPRFSYLFTLILMITSCTKDQSYELKDDISIYDRDGIAVAYCNYNNENECIVYLWNGKPTSYLIAEESELYGFNGKFLGWKESGIYYDLDGKRIGFDKNAIAIATLPESIKSIKEMLPLKSLRELKPMKPIKSIDWSIEPLDSFLLKGRN
jgi:hypothetical protein